MNDKNNELLEINELIETLASLEHERWSRWMRYLFTKGEFNNDGSFTIDAESAQRWQRQMNTAYSNLSETEKKSDRAEANLTLQCLFSKIKLLM